MNRKVLIVLTVAISLGMGNPFLWAAKEKKKKTAPVVPAAGALKPTAIEEAKAKEALKAQEWILYLAPFKDIKGKSHIDIVTFSGDNKFISKNLVAKGYKESIYTVAFKDGAAVWESEQENPDGDIAFWRGELKAKVMQGIVSILQKNGAIDDLYFTTIAPQEKI